VARKVIQTADGSATIYIEELNEHYHSKHGAIQEALHVYIKSGLFFFVQNNEAQKVNILEIGFGTGLNTLLTLMEVEHLKIDVNYIGVEAFPVDQEVLTQLNYSEISGQKDNPFFDFIHRSQWEDTTQISKYFQLTKRCQKFEDITDIHTFDLIYYDAFGPRVQPELWGETMFSKMYKALKANGTLVTYSAKGSVRRSLQSVGFSVEKIPGPPGKREMLRAVKLI